MRISYSAIDTYKTCPLKFKYQEIDKIKVPKSKEAAFGTAIHSALKYMFQRGPLFPILDEVINFFQNNFDEQKTKIKLGEAEADAFKKQGIEILKKFYKNNQPWNYNIFDLESRFQVAILDPQTKEEHILSGIMDRIDKPSDEEYEIIDYKTSKKMPSQDMVDQNLQLSIYHLGLLKNWPHLKDKAVKLSLYFLKHGEKISTTRDEKDLANTQQEIIGKINEIEERRKTDDFPPTPSALCDWCGYKKICPMWSHLYEEDSPDDEQIKKIIQEYFDFKSQNQQNNLRLKELQAKIKKYMEEKELNRVFGEEGYLTQATKTTPIYDKEKLKDAIVGEKKTSYLSATKKKIKKEND